MAGITTARAWANNEVAYIAWDTDGKIEGCLGFEVTRVYVDADGNPVTRPDGTPDRVKCAAWVAFKGQRNPNWLPQDTGVWPVQKFSWRDLTLRKKRDRAERRPDEVRVRYEIRPVGDLKPGRPPVSDNGRSTQRFAKKDPSGQIVKGPDGKTVWVTGPAYQGDARPLGYLGPAVPTNPILVTSRRPPFTTTFTNGILAAQWLRNVLVEDDGQIGADELLKKISNPDDVHRKYLAGDVLPLIHRLFDRKGSFHLALYELEDEELEQLLLANGERVHVILSNSAAKSGRWDARNEAARKRLHAANVDVQDRMFNNSKHIGHNKFVVHLDEDSVPRAVLTGSTNWTATGVAGQTNNAVLVEDDAIAAAFLDCWNRMHDGDVQATPRPLSKAMPDNQQRAPFRTANATPAVTAVGPAELRAWFSPNRPEREKPRSKTHPAPTPPDLADVYRRIRMARQAVLFLAFYPAQRGVDCIIGEAIDVGRKDRSLVVVGAVSSPQAMPNYVAKEKDEDGEVVDEGASPATFDEENISLVRASRIDDETLLGDFGVEQLTASRVGAIIHDKILVVDPLSEKDCTVVLGSHNLGFKASYSNDENLLVVTGHRDLAVAYAVHVLDVFDHYRFRAAEQDLHRQGKKGWSGFLDTDDRWQDGYVSGRKGALSRYFAR